MKAVRAVGGSVAVVDVDEPPGVGEAIKVAAASICASDLMYLTYDLGRLLGHELAGFREDGSAVIVEAMYGCNECPRCLSGRYNLCPTHSQRSLGVGLDGGMAEHYRAPSDRLISLPSGLDVRDASIVEPATVAWHALRLAGAVAGRRVAVVGAGALGLLAVAGARRMGAATVDLEARHLHQLEAGERLGATIGTSGQYDVVIEAAGSLAALAHSCELVGPGGSVVSLGVYLGSVELPWHNLFMSEARLVPSLGYCVQDDRKEIEHVVDMLATDPAIADTVITHRFPISDAKEAFRVAADRSTKSIRVVIEP